jgi:hypothetical protein
MGSPLIDVLDGVHSSGLQPTSKHFQTFFLFFFDLKNWSTTSSEAESSELPGIIRHRH